MSSVLGNCDRLTRTAPVGSHFKGPQPDLEPPVVSTISANEDIKFIGFRSDDGVDSLATRAWLSCAAGSAAGSPQK